MLDRNLNETPDEALKDITVEKTMIDGKFVYEKTGTT
jgi:predicted amidohydrolase YtcJ